MAGQAELLFEKEIKALKKYADNKEIQLVQLEGLSFVLKNLLARNGDTYALHVMCDSYPLKPPIFRWCNPMTLEFENPKDIPKGAGGYFHGCGTPCAPWNLNAYKEFQSKAPHGDWNSEGWQNNPKTGKCNTIPRMILRICTELKSSRYQGRVSSA